jgi:hypothetical protein
MTPKITNRHSLDKRNNSGKATYNKAPKAGPASEPAPPMMTINTILMLSSMVKLAGAATRKKLTCNTPPMPAKAVPMANTVVL